MDMIYYAGRNESNSQSTTEYSCSFNVPQKFNDPEVYYLHITSNYTESS